MALQVRTLSTAEHLAFLRAQRSASFLQCPSWAAVKSEWASESLGWVDDAGAVIGAGLVLYRRIPKLRWSLAYLPEGPVIDWAAPDLGAWLGPMVQHLSARGAFGVRMGPPVPVRRWCAETVKRGITAGSARRIADLAADEASEVGNRIGAALRDAGWRPPRETHGFSAGQPRYVLQLPLAGRAETDLLRGFNQLWRRNIRRAEKAGVQVSRGGYDDLPAFHALYLLTAARDGFTGRPLAYFRRMWRALSAEDPQRIRLYLARHEGDLVAATTMVQVGEHAWYSYGASSTDKREVRGSNAVQWAMIRDARAAGARVYDLRGITDTLAEDDRLFGLVQFKLGTGGEVVEYPGEWDLPLNRLLFQAFSLYLRRR